jgi:hypothetical protein
MAHLRSGKPKRFAAFARPQLKKTSGQDSFPHTISFLVKANTGTALDFKAMPSLLLLYWLHQGMKSVILNDTKGNILIETVI